MPESVNKNAILDSIDSHLDVDCLGGVASEIFYNNYNNQIDLGYPTALACMALLDSANLDLKNPPRLGEAGKKIVVLGQGMLVGKPVSALLDFRNISSTPIDIYTENKEKLIYNHGIGMTPP